MMNMIVKDGISFVEREKGAAKERVRERDGLNAKGKIKVKISN